MEADLQSYLDSYASTHSYDEYLFDLDEIGHDPYVLISLLTAYHSGAWTLADVQGTLSMLFDRQYILTMIQDEIDSALGFLRRLFRGLGGVLHGGGGG